MQPQQDLPMPREDDNVSENFGPYKDEKSIVEVQNIGKDHRDSVSKSSDTGSCARVARTS